MAYTLPAYRKEDDQKVFAPHTRLSNVVLVWCGSGIDRVMIADYAVEEDDPLTELLDAPARLNPTELPLISSLIPWGPGCPPVADFLPSWGPVLSWAALIFPLRSQSLVRVHTGSSVNEKAAASRRSALGGSFDVSGGFLT
jgi:hypothetical protein